MRMPTEAEILEALVEAGPRSTSWLCMRFDIRGESGFQAVRSALDRMVAQKQIKLDTQGLWSVISKAPAQSAQPAASPAAS